MNEHAKFEEILKEIRKMCELQKEISASIKNMGDVQILRINHIYEEIEEIKDAAQSASDARKDIYKRIENLERNCAGRHGFDRRRGDIPPDDSIVDVWLGRKLLWVATCIIGPLLGAIGVKILELL